VVNLTHKIGDKVDDAEIIRVYDDEKCYPYCYLARAKNGKIVVLREQQKPISSNLPVIPLEKLDCSYCLLKDKTCSGALSSSSPKYCFLIFNNFKEAPKEKDDMKWLEE